MICGGGDRFSWRAPVGCLFLGGEDLSHAHEYAKEKRLEMRDSQREKKVVRTKAYYL